MVFSHLDKDGDGYINAKELQHGYNKFTKRGRSNSEIVDMIKFIDLDNNGKINYKGKAFLIPG